MADYPLQDIDSIQYPKRRPFLVLVVVASVAAVVVWFFMWSPSPEGATVAAEEAVAPAPSAPEAATETVPTAGAGASVARQSPAVAGLVQQARLAEGQGPQQADSLAEARRLYLEALQLTMTPAMRNEVEERLGRINMEFAFTPLPLPGVKIEYVVVPGDSIDRIAKKLGTTTALIQRSNQIANPNRIMAGDRFRVLTGKLSLHSSKSQHDLEVRLNGAFFKRYKVGLGKFSKTPVGTFVVTDRIAEPVWWKPDGKEVPFGHPENILGTRWLAIRATGDTPDVQGYGIHGTWDDTSIGKDESAGCVRMRNPEVEELFDLIPIGTPVTITE